MSFSLFNVIAAQKKLRIASCSVGEPDPAGYSSSTPSASLALPRPCKAVRNECAAPDRCDFEGSQAKAIPEEVS